MSVRLLGTSVHMTTYVPTQEVHIRAKLLRVQQEWVTMQNLADVKVVTLDNNA